MTAEVIRPIFASETERRGASPPMKPRDAATLVLVDRAGPAPRVLMGRRRADLKFMPGLTVFPGGRVDAADGMMEHVGGFSDETAARLRLRAGRVSGRGMRALALCAVRETYEETGLLLGVRRRPQRCPGPDWAAFVDREVTPDLSALRLVCRAITPPGRPRRFDTRFFLAERDAVAAEVPDAERIDTDLQAVEWLTLAQARERELAFITRAVLDDLQPLVDGTAAAVGMPFYYSRGEKHLKEVL